jgi:hypothetical protein
MRESAYQAKLIKKLRRLFPGCFIIKNDSGYIQGIPDLLLLFGPHWAMLEVKASENEPFQPNQEYYLEQLDAMSFAAVIFPANEEEILDALQSAFTTRRKARVSQR